MVIYKVYKFVFLFFSFFFIQSNASYAKDKMMISLLAGAKMPIHTQYPQWNSIQLYSNFQSRKKIQSIYGIEFKFPLTKKIGINTGLNLSDFSTYFRTYVASDRNYQYFNNREFDYFMEQKFTTRIFGCQFPFLISYKTSKRWSVMLGCTFNYYKPYRNEENNTIYLSTDSIRFESKYGSEFKSKIATSLQLRLVYAISRRSSLVLITNYDLGTLQKVYYSSSLDNGIASQKKTYNFSAAQKYFYPALVFQFSLKGLLFNPKPKVESTSELNEEKLIETRK